MIIFLPRELRTRKDNKVHSRLQYIVKHLLEAKFLLGCEKYIPSKTMAQKRKTIRLTNSNI